MSKSGGDNIAKDPYLTGRLFDRKTLDYQAIQKSYTTEMGQIFDKVITLDKQRLEEQKSILVDYMMNLKEFHRNSTWIEEFFVFLNDPFTILFRIDRIES